MLTSYHADPKKPEKSIKIDRVQERQRKEIANVEKRDRSHERDKPKDRKPN